MTYPNAGLVADLLYPPSGDPGYTSINHTAVSDSGVTDPTLVQTVLVTPSTSLFDGWQDVWFKDVPTAGGQPRWAGGAFTDGSGAAITGCVTHFLLPPGADIYLPEYYGKMTNVGRILDIRTRNVRVFPSNKPDNPTAEKVQPIGGNARWAGGSPSMTYPKALPKTSPRQPREPEYLLKVQIRVQVAQGDPVPTFLLDNRYPKWLNASELVGQRTLVG